LAGIVRWNPEVKDGVSRLYYTAGGHDLRFFENPHPCPLPKGEGEKAAIRTRFEYICVMPFSHVGFGSSYLVAGRSTGLHF